MNENISFTDYASGIQLPYCSKLSINWKNDNDLTIFRNDIIVILWRSFVSLVKFSYWSKFPFNITTGSGFMTIFSFQFSSMSSKSGNRNTPVWVLPNIWRLTRVRDIRFGKNVCNKMLLNDAKCWGYSFYYFWVIKGKTGGKITHPPPRLRLKKKGIYP